MVSAVWTLLLLAGFASCTPSKRPDWLPNRPDWLPDRPDWFPDWVPDTRPEWWPIGPDGEFIRPEWWPQDWQRPEWWPITPEGEWVKPDWWPEEINRPEWWPISPDGEWIKPEWWPEEINRPEWWPVNPDGEWERPEWLPDLESATYVPRAKGTAADITEFPGIVQVEVGSGALWVQGCAGSILTSSYILSAARCFSGPIFTERYRRIRAGSSTRYTGGAVVNIDSVKNHPSFGENNFDGDITLVKLADALGYGPSIQQTTIIAQGTSLAAGLTVTHAGWGITAEGSILSSENLYQIDLVISDLNACVERYANTPVPITISNNMICAAQAGSPGRDADIRDVGAPLYYDKILVGIASSGFFFGNATLPLVSTAVSSYTNWIVANAL